MGKVTFEITRADQTYAGLSAGEKRLYDWAKAGAPDLRVVFGTTSYEEEEIEPFQHATLVIERRLPNGWATFCLNMPTKEPVFLEMFDHMEQLARAGLERTISEMMWYRADDLPRSWDEDRNSALSN